MSNEIYKHIQPFDRVGQQILKNKAQFPKVLEDLNVADFSSYETYHLSKV